MQDPELFTSRRAAVAGDATSLMAALGYAPLEGLPGRYEFRASTTPVVLRRLALASKALDALREEPTRRAAQRFDHLPPEPALGISGTTTLTLLSGIDAAAAAPTTEADDVLEKVMGWLRAASERTRRRRGRCASPPSPQLTPIC